MFIPMAKGEGAKPPGLPGGGGGGEARIGPGAGGGGAGGGGELGVDPGTVAGVMLVPGGPNTPTPGRCGKLRKFSALLNLPMQS
jgi:hypothetical protein